MAATTTVNDFVPSPGFDYRQAPLGSQPGEAHLQAPYNQGRANVIVRVRNLSAIRPRRVVLEYVSGRQGGSKQLNDPEFKKLAAGKYGNTSVDELRKRALDGENMNLEDERLAPIDFAIRWDSTRWIIPHTDPETGEAAPWITVESGVWDLYMGNYDRMHGGDNRERIDEIQQLNGRNLAKFALPEPGMDEERPFAFLEFAREVIKVSSVAIDANLVRNGKILEV